MYTGAVFREVAFALSSVTRNHFPSSPVNHRLLPVHLKDACSQLGAKEKFDHHHHHHQECIQSFCIPAAHSQHSHSQLTERKYCFINVYLVSETYLCFLIGFKAVYDVRVRVELLVTWGDGGEVLLLHCGCWQVAQLHQTDPGEVPMTCFTPTLVPCRKSKRKPSHSLSICLKLVEKGLLWQDHVSILCCHAWPECKCAEKKKTGNRVLI